MTTPPRLSYRTDLTDDQWELLAPLIVLPTGGAPNTTDLREVLNAIFYQLRTGCQWDFDFPPEGTVRRYFHYFKRTGQWERINDHLRRAVRVKAGRDPPMPMLHASSPSDDARFDNGSEMRPCSQSPQMLIPQ